MSDKKLTVRKFNYYFILTVILFVFFLGYVTAVVFVNKSNLSWETTNGNFQLILNLLITKKTYTAPVTVLTAWGDALMLSYIFGFATTGIGWLLEWRKRTKANKDVSGLKNKLDKAESERNFYKKKYEILEQGINSSAPVETKTVNKKSKKKNKVVVIILVLFILVSAIIGWKLYSADKKRGHKDSTITQLKNIDDQMTIDLTNSAY